VTYSISGTVAGKDVRFQGLGSAAEALRICREMQATGQVSALWVYHGDRQITLEELKRHAGGR
jgi:hypothetical protein